MSQLIILYIIVIQRTEQRQYQTRSCRSLQFEPYAARGSPVAIRKYVFWKLLEHSVVTFTHSGFLGLRYVVWSYNKGGKGVVYVYPRYAPMGENSLLSAFLP